MPPLFRPFQICIDPWEVGHGSEAILVGEGFSTDQPQKARAMQRISDYNYFSNNTRVA